MILTDDDGPQRPLDSNTRTRFDVKFFSCILKKLHFTFFFFSTEKLTRLFLLKDRKMTTTTCFRYYDVFVQTRSSMTTRGSFLDRPGNFSGPKTNLKIKTGWIVAQFLADKLVNFVSLTYCFVVLFSKLLKLWSWMQSQQTQNSFPGPKSYRDFWEPAGPRRSILFSRHNDTGSCTVLTIEKILFS